jgi:hypothetical protein
LPLACRSRAGRRRLLAIDTAQDIALSRVAPAAIGESEQHLIPDLMAVPVVDRLEVVRIEHQNGKRQIIPLGREPCSTSSSADITTDA